MDGPNGPNGPNGPSPQRSKIRMTRAKYACRECNSRRVKCDVTLHKPCSNCSVAGVECEIFPSRRGRYNRYVRTSQRLQQPRANTAATEEESTSSSIPHTTASTPGPTRASPSPPSSLTPPTSSFFFGESNPLTLVSATKSSASTSSTSSFARKQRLIFPAIPFANNEPVGHGLSAATMRYLGDEGALTTPDLKTCLPVIEAYFKWYHPSWPVVERAEVVKSLGVALQAQQRQTFPRMLFLLQGILFIGSTYCDEGSIKAMGFKDRWHAKGTFYRRGRLLFHADWEKDGIALIQALFLMSFWRGKTTDVRDARYWLGIAITLSESYGLHRSSRSLGGNVQANRLRRRIWWSIYVRERQAAASLGLPSRIRDEDCDIEPLTPSDFLSELSSPPLSSSSSSSSSPSFSFPTSCGTFTSENVTYLIKMVEISRLFGRVIDSHFVPGRSPPTALELRELDQTLQRWKDDLPLSMRHLSEEGNDSVSTCLLHLSYHHLRILIHRHAFLRNQEGQDSEVAVRAACQICRIAIDMSTNGTLRYSQMHLLSSLFAALCIHTLSIRRCTGVPRRIAEHRAETCLLCLREVQRYWTINNRLLDLFFQHLDRSIAARFSQEDAGEEVGAASVAAAAAATPGETGGSDAISGGQGGAANLVSTSPQCLRPSETGPGPFLQEDLLGGQYFNLENGSWEGEDGIGDLSLFLRADPPLLM